MRSPLADANSNWQLLVPAGVELERLYTGTTWGEGPVWISETSSVRWSDIPNDRILEFDSLSGATDVYRDGVEFTNGRTLDLDGRVIQCSHGRRSVEMDWDGSPRNVVSHFGGRRLNSPNDVVVASDGTIWFTDPPYGILNAREGHPGKMEYGACYVFRFDPRDESLIPVVTDRAEPNGLAFSPDESLLYVSDSAAGDGGIYCYEVDVSSARATAGRHFATPYPGVADGFRADISGRIWSSGPGAVHVYSPGGAELLRIPVPEVVSNLCFGGPSGHDLYITATTSLYRIRTTTSQATRPTL